jgi:hypothetical protein
MSVRHESTSLPQARWQQSQKTSVVRYGRARSPWTTVCIEKLDLGGLAVEAQLFWLQSSYGPASLLYQLEAGHDAPNPTVTPAGTRELP